MAFVNCLFSTNYSIFCTCFDTGDRCWRGCRGLKQLGQLVITNNLPPRCAGIPGRDARKWGVEVSVKRRMEMRSAMIRKLKSGRYRLYSRKKNQKTGKCKNLGTFATRAQAEKHERAVQFFKRA